MEHGMEVPLKPKNRTTTSTAAAAESLQSCPTLCDPIDGGPPGSPVPGILQARTLEWAAISFSSAWKGQVKVKSLSRVRLFTTPWSAAYQSPPSMGFSRQEYWSGVPLPSPRSHWHIVITQRLQFTLGFTLGVVCFVGLNKCIVHMSIILISEYFHCPKNPLCSAYLFPELPNPVFYLHSFIFSRMLYSWSQTVYSSFRLVFFN